MPIVREHTVVRCRKCITAPGTTWRVALALFALASLRRGEAQRKRSQKGKVRRQGSSAKPRFRWPRPPSEPAPTAQQAPEAPAPVPAPPPTPATPFRVTEGIAQAVSAS